MTNYYSTLVHYYSFSYTSIVPRFLLVRPNVHAEIDSETNGPGHAWGVEAIQYCMVDCVLYTCLFPVVVNKFTC